MATFDELMDAMLALTRGAEHLPGGHDQSTHGNGGGSSGSSRKLGDLSGKKVEKFEGGKVPKKVLDEVRQWEGRRGGVAAGTITNRSNNDITLVKDGDEIVGVVGFRPERVLPPRAGDMPDGDYAYIDGIATKRSGLGKTVMQSAVDKARGESKGLYLEANTDVFGFYKSIGMHQSKEDERTFYWTADEIAGMSG